MVQSNWVQMRIDEERRNDQMRNAENHRRVKAALVGRKHVRFYRPLLAKMGRRMVTWGLALQDHYENRPVSESNSFSRPNQATQGL